MCRLSWNMGASTSWNPYGPPRAVTGLLYLFIYIRMLVSTFYVYERYISVFARTVCNMLWKMALGYSIEVHAFKRLAHQMPEKFQTHMENKHKFATSNSEVNSATAVDENFFSLFYGLLSQTASYACKISEYYLLTGNCVSHTNDMAVLHASREPRCGYPWQTPSEINLELSRLSQEMLYLFQWHYINSVNNKLNYALYKYLLPHREHRMRSLAEASKECSFAVYWKNQMKYVNTRLGAKEIVFLVSILAWSTLNARL